MMVISNVLPINHGVLQYYFCSQLLNPKPNKLMDTRLRPNTSHSWVSLTVPQLAPFCIQHPTMTLSDKFFKKCSTSAKSQHAFCLGGNYGRWEEQPQHVMAAGKLMNLFRPMTLPSLSSPFIHIQNGSNFELSTNIKESL